MQGGQALRTEAYEQYAAGTKGEVQRRRWALLDGLLAVAVEDVGDGADRGAAPVSRGKSGQRPSRALA